MEAMRSFQPLPPVVYEYRLYYDPDTRIGTIKTADLTDQPEGEYIVVTRERYDSIEFCPAFKILLDGRIERIYVDTVLSTMLQLSNKGFKTIKDNAVFIVDDTYTGEIDRWEAKND